MQLLCEEQQRDLEERQREREAQQRERKEHQKEREELQRQMLQVQGMLWQLMHGGGHNSSIGKSLTTPSASSFLILCFFFK